MKTFNIVPFDGHLIFEDSGKTILVDTGSPVTISSFGNITFMEQSFVAKTAMAGNNAETLSELIGRNIDVLMGMDILTQFHVQINYHLNKIIFSREPIPMDGAISVHIESGLMGGIIIPMCVDGKTLKFVLDTGAKISYINNEFTVGSRVIDTRDDFNPAVGRFTTPIFEKEVSIANNKFIVNFGNLPSILEMTIKFMKVDGIIGYDLLNNFVVLIDFINNTLYI
jgi:hypothetical protein